MQSKSCCSLRTMKKQLLRNPKIYMCIAAPDCVRCSSACRARGAVHSAQVQAAVAAAAVVALSLVWTPALTLSWLLHCVCHLRRSEPARQQHRLQGVAREAQQQLAVRVVLRVRLLQLLLAVLGVLVTWSWTRMRCCSRHWQCPCR
jgi:hypothetical protein